MSQPRQTVRKASPQQLKWAAELAIKEALEHLRREQREPDGWEGMRLQSAIDAIAYGHYLLSSIHAHKAVLPRRKEGEWPRDETTPTLDQLTRALAIVIRLPAHHH